MPTYQYRCTDCGHEFEEFQSFTDDALTVCPTCGGRLRKVFNAVGVVFKGSGFYRNDSRKTESSGSAGSSAPAAKSSGASDSSGSSDSSSSAGSSDSSSSGSSGSTSSPASAGTSGGSTSGSTPAG